MIDHTKTLFFYFLTFLTKISVSIPVDNEVAGDLQIECDASTISVQVSTENPFFGTIFVKDFFIDSPCFIKGTGRLSAYLRFDIGFCGTLRVRTLNPRGTVVDATIVISFHPLFITKVDRSYHVRCIYQESEKNVSTSITVDDISTQLYTQNVTMPVCSYQILDGGPFGKPVAFGLIGQQVYHQWKCETETVETFCMLVHTCSTDDGKGDRAPLIDSNGCAIDRYLLSNLEYPADLMAGQEAHVYKFADREALFFQCQISITIKEPGEDCPRPICGEESPPEGGGGGGDKNPDGKDHDQNDEAEGEGADLNNIAPYGSKAKANAAISYPVPDEEPAENDISNHITSDSLVETSLTASDVEELQNLNQKQNSLPRTFQKRESDPETLDVRIKFQVIEDFSSSTDPSPSFITLARNVCVSPTDVVPHYLYLAISYLSSVIFTIIIAVICRKLYFY